MPEFLIRLLIVVLALWLIQKLIEVVELKEPAPKIIWIVALVLGIIYLLVGAALPPFRP
jgi:uncharacterized membrane protein YvlD (DUF360 family)